MELHPAACQILTDPDTEKSADKIIAWVQKAAHVEKTLVSCRVDLGAATGATARRAIDDDTVLQGWMRQGLDLVSDCRADDRPPQKGQKE